MTRFVVDAPTLIRLAAGEIAVDDAHELLLPTLARSEALALLYARVRDGALARGDAMTTLERIGRMPNMRFLGDGVLRRTAWKLGEQLDWPTTLRTEYLALGQLQRCVLVTEDAELAAAAEGICAVGRIEDLATA